MKVFCLILGVFVIGLSVAEEDLHFVEDENPAVKQYLDVDSGFKDKEGGERLVRQFFGGFGRGGYGGFGRGGYGGFGRGGYGGFGRGGFGGFGRYGGFGREFFPNTWDIETVLKRGDLFETFGKLKVCTAG
uniref:Uncharacterized protein n=1 Tax=Megaselia scalaris TaxID=36166 RepID=T1GAP4_MEGSC